MNNGHLVIKTKIDNRTFDAQIEQVQKELENLKKRYAETRNMKPFKGQEEDLKNLRLEIEKTSNKLVGLQRSQLNEINNSLTKTEGHTGNIIKKVGKWALAIFSVRSAYMLIRRLTSTISQYNDQIRTDLEYMNYALAKAFEPVVQWMINAVYKLLSLINGVTQALFDWNMFSEASASNFKKSAASTKAIKNNLLGFDEVNKLGDDTSAGGGSATLTPTVDLSEIQKSTTEAKKFITDITDFWEKEAMDAINNTNGNWDAFLSGIILTGKGFYDIFKGIVDFVVGLWDMLVGLLSGDVDKMKEGFNKFLTSIIEILAGVIEVACGLIMTVLGTIKGLFLDAWNWLSSKIFKPIGNFFSNLWASISNGAASAWNGVKNAFGNVTSFFGGLWDKIKGVFSTIGTKIGDVVGSSFKAAINGALRVVESVINTPIRAINGLLSVINTVPGVSISKLNTISLPRLASGGIVNNPGMGVNMGSYVAGERGAEAVLPLTDDTMQRLASMIPITIDLTNTIDGRVLSRRLETIRSNNNFSINGG